MKNEKLSELLTELSTKAKLVETKYANVKAETQEDLQNWELEAKQKVAVTKVAFEEKKESLNEEAQSHWDIVKSNFENGVAKIKTDFRQAQYNMEASNAELNAEWAEDDAEMSVYFALDALADAEQAIIEAVKARKSADSYLK
ncbi:hypothetical protein HZP25_15700 [Elizabethkingia anophelis]|nr:hypothetical protein [Elizabethkingia anophelis]